MNDISYAAIDTAHWGPRSASILARLGGENFLVSIGASNFLFGETQVSFTLWRGRQASLVAIGLEPNGSFSMACIGCDTAGTLETPRLMTATVPAGANVAAALGELVEIEALGASSSRTAGQQQAAALAVN
jgi:hypothetical protein